MHPVLDTIDKHLLAGPAERHTADPAHPHRRRYLPAYRRKFARVRYVWTGASLVVLSWPTVATLLAVGLFTTFLVFMLLDETP